MITASPRPGWRPITIDKRRTRPDATHVTATDWLAIYGSVLATILAVWDVTKYFLERPRLRVQCYVANIIRPGDRPGDLPRLLAYSVANTGGKAVVVNSIGGVKTNGNYFVIDPNPQLPHTLQPGESLRITCPLPPDIQAIKHFHASDGLGKDWKASTDAVKQQLAARPQ